MWTLVDFPDGRQAIENKWIFKKKTNADGNVTIYKARLVAKGFRQVQGVDYDETFSPVAMLKSVRIMLAIAAFHDYEIWQMDVKTAFLSGFLEEELYMMQPEGFVDPKGTNKVCKLQRCIYGLVQASRSWNICFDHLIKAYIPTLRCLHQSINGSLELAHFVSTFRIDKTFWLHHIQLFFEISIKECSFDIHLPNFIIIKCGNC